MRIKNVLKFTAKWILPSMAIVSALLFLDFRSTQTEVKPETKVDSVVESFNGGQAQNINIKESQRAQGKTLQVENGKTEASYVSAETQAKFAFNGILTEWTQSNVEHEALALEMRLLSKGEWTDWFSVNEWETDESKDASDISKNYSQPVFIDGSTAFQYKIGLKVLDPNETPEISGLKFTYIDTTKGPKPTSNTVGGVSKANAGAPFRIISRAEWGADPALMTWAPEYSGSLQKVIIHHTAGPNDYSDGAATVRGIYQFHSITRGWGDIGYNFLIDKWGNIYEGRFGGDGVTGGHARGYNSKSVGISMMGTFDTVNISGVANEALTTLAAYKTAQYNIDPAGASNISGFSPYSNAPETLYTYNIAGHRDYASTACPGGLFYGTFANVRSIAAQKYPAYSQKVKLIRAEVSQKIFLVSGNQKYHILSAKEFENFGFSWGAVRTLTEEEIASYPEVGTLTNLVKKANAPEIYFIDSGTKKHVPSPELFQEYGFNSESVVVLEDQIIDNISQGKTLTRLIKGPDPAVYFVEAGKKRHIANPEIFNKAGFNWGDIVVLSSFNSAFIQEGKTYLIAGTTIKTLSDPRIYLFTNSKKTLIQSPEIFNNYGFSWSAIATISTSEIASYPEVGTLTNLVKKTNAPEIYFIDSGTKKHVPSPELFQEYGFNSESVVVLEDQIIDNIPQGKTLTRLIKGSDPAVYFVEAGKKRHVLDPKTFIELGFSPEDVVVMTDSSVASIPRGAVLLINNTIIKSTLDPRVYFYSGNEKKHIPSPEIFNSYGFSWERITLLKEDDLARIPESKALTRLIKGSDPAVYFVEAGKKRHVLDPKTFIELGFSPEDVVEITESLHVTLPIGADIFSSGTLIKSALDPRVYVVDGLTKKYISSPEMFGYFGFLWGEIKIVSESNILNYSGDKVLTRIVRGSGEKIYYIENGTKKHISGPQVFGEYGLLTTDIIEISDALLNIIPDGEPLLPRSNGVVVSGTTTTDITDIYGTTIKTIPAETLIKIFYSGGEYLVASGQSFFISKAYIRIVPRGGVTIIHTYNDVPSWNTTLNDNKFKGAMEIRYSPTSNALWAINELPMEDYLKGIAETTTTSPTEHIKTMTVAARSYAYYHVSRGGKYPGEPFHLKNSRNGNGDDQQYKGYGLEARFPQLVNAVNQTQNQVVTYGGSPVITPYFSSSDGRTRSAYEKWGWTNTPWLQSVADPDCNGRALSGHGVGLSGYGSSQRAARGDGYQNILNYYFQGTGIGNIANPNIKVAITKVQY